MPIIKKKNEKDGTIDHSRSMYGGGGEIVALDWTSTVKKLCPRITTLTPFSYF